MHPGTTSSEAPRLAPRRLPGPWAALLARDWVAWEACLVWVLGWNWMRIWDWSWNWNWVGRALSRVDGCVNLVVVDRRVVSRGWSIVCLVD